MDAINPWNIVRVMIAENANAQAGAKQEACYNQIPKHPFVKNGEWG